MTPQVRAEYARPPVPSPYERYRPDDGDYARPYEFSEASDPVNSLVRFQVGPAVLLQPTSPGLFTAIDIGRRSVGARLSGSWLRPESEVGLSAYTAELWIDFRHRYQLHPILGAGAGWLHGGAVDGDGAGSGVLRGALEYELPIDDADARVGLNALALVPAFGTKRARPWATAALTIAAGF